jgi:Nucleotidyl transferase AbiEii toxin, Type IV TA system
LLEGATIERIRNDAQYGCLRIKTYAYVDGARVRVVVDSGFGDAIEPGLAETDLPVLLDFPAPRLRSYVGETVIAEKFEAMVALGRANSCVKDLDDICLLAQTHEFRDDKLARAIDSSGSRQIGRRVMTAPLGDGHDVSLLLARWETFSSGLRDRLSPGVAKIALVALASKLM